MLSIDVLPRDSTPLAAPTPAWPGPAPATWPATTATLISGEQDAILVDALITAEEARRLTTWIRDSGKRLTTVYITHGHADHFLGLSVVLEAFPQARAVARPEVVPYAQEQLTPRYLAFWESLFPGQLPQGPPVAPEAMTGDVLLLEGEEIWPILVGQSDTHPSTVVHVPSARAVVGGDVGYNGIHMWLTGTDHAARQGWLAALDLVAALEPRVVVAGHSDPNRENDDAAAVLAFSQQYITDFDELVAASSTPGPVIAGMTERYPDLGNPYTLVAAATAQFPGEQP